MEIYGKDPDALRTRSAPPEHRRRASIMADMGRKVQSLMSHQRRLPGQRPSIAPINTTYVLLNKDDLQ